MAAGGRWTTVLGKKTTWNNHLMMLCSLSSLPTLSCLTVLISFLMTDGPGISRMMEAEPIEKSAGAQQGQVLRLVTYLPLDS